jgi:predicted membrane protein
MKLPYPITRARRYDTGIHPQHVLFAATFLPALALVAYIVASLVFSIPS